MHWQLQTAALQLSAPATPVPMVQSCHFLLRKQEAPLNLCPTQWLVLAAEVRYLSHTEGRPHFGAFNMHLRRISLRSQLLHPLTTTPASSTSANLPASLCPPAVEQRRWSDLLRANHRESAAEGHGNPPGSVRAGGKKRRDSPEGSWHRVKPAGGGALSLRALLL